MQTHFSGFRNLLYIQHLYENPFRKGDFPFVFVCRLDRQMEDYDE